MEKINIIGAGLAGLCAAITLAENGYECNLISLQYSERSQSVLAEGGINAALDTMGENDNYIHHYHDTMKGGVYLADPNAVYGLTKNAPEIVTWLQNLGVPFRMKEGRLILRNFGGQKKKRTAYAKSSTGKMIVGALIDEARKYEAKGLIKRYPNHQFIRLLLTQTDAKKRCIGVRVKDIYSDKTMDFTGTIILASGGMNGVFPEMTTGTVANSGDVTATVFAQGVVLSNLEMIQYHPTTIGISGKRCLVSEAARGEGGRLYIKREGKPWYFMEEKYPELKNLMPRDVVSREMYFVSGCENQVYLDMTELDTEVWTNKLSDLREEIRYYLSIDPQKEPVPVEPGIHYFMGGINTNEYHQTNIENLYAAGECTSQYHGANRLGGNSMLGAIYGGKVAAKHIISCRNDENHKERNNEDEYKKNNGEDEYKKNKDENEVKTNEADEGKKASSAFVKKLSEILLDGLGIVRNEERLQLALEKTEQLKIEAKNTNEENRILLARAMLESALMRKESRGAHYREDYPDTDESYRKVIYAQCENNRLTVEFHDIPDNSILSGESTTTSDSGEEVIQV